MLKWNHLTQMNQLDDIIEISKITPCLIFKHSTRCSISSLALNRLQSDWDIDEEKIKTYYLDLIANRAISNQVATLFQVYHESPQVLVIHNGECTYDSSHLDITVADLKEAMEIVG